jgi:hypothetical protein
MEDIKQIQEFFSKPLNENVYVEAFKLEKALKGMGYDVKVKAVDDFGTNVFEIYFNNPADADDDSIFYDVKKLGYDNVRVFANPQESVKEVKVDYDFSERELKRVLKLLGRGASTEIKMIKAFEKALGRELTKDELFEATEEEETEFHTKLDKLVHDTFGKRKGEMEEYNSGIYYNPAKEPSRTKAKEASKSALERVKDMIKKIASEQKMGEALADYEEKEANYDELYNDYAYKAVKEVAEEEGYSQYLKTDDNPEGKTKGLDTKTMNKILMNVIKDLDELKQLGEGVIEEELCAKGKAYIKKRQAAGEKSSAYLSGRAVKVCKGQMKG